MRATPTSWMVLALLTTAAVASTTADPRGWTEGEEPASGTSRVLGPISETPIEAKLPRALAKRIDRPTLLVYFSPTCPHCIRVAPELQALSERLGEAAQVIGISGASATDAELLTFTTEHGITFEIYPDSDREIGAALNIRSTPSAVLVVRKGRKLYFEDLWYPYVPGTDTLVQMRVSEDPWSVFTPNTYMGNHACGACHRTEIESWTLSHHSIAWRTLVKNGDHTNAECTECHVTGAGKPTGWDGAPTSALVNVGCESCHGPGGPHDGHPTTPSDTCEGCHDANHSIGFSYERGVPLIDHYRTATMADASFREARRALVDGEVEQSLLSFDEGEYVGTASCTGCHEAEHTQWSATTHAGAMTTLNKGKSTDNPTCVSCHATPKTPGPRPTDVEAYFTSDGVGCESCHGPGGAHVQDGGGKDNIVGLGESCPVCVVEAICTSCHTKAWDAAWELDQRLPAVKHVHPATTPEEHLPGHTE